MADKCLSKNPNFKYDEACLDILNFLNESVTVYRQYTECHKCEFNNLTTLKPQSNTSILVNNTEFTLQFYYTVGEKKYCEFQRLLSEHYRYGWNITKNCVPVYIKEPADSAYLPILSAFIILFCFGTIWYMVKCIYKNSDRLRQFLNINTEIQNDLGGSNTTPLVIGRPPSTSSSKKHPHRIKSIDIFRGFCITIMIFVNYGGGQYWFFKHSIWNGLTFADLVFPWFLWIMGFSLIVSMQRKLRRAVPRRQLVIDVIRRSLLLILLGLMINSNRNDLLTIAQLRFPGVLQRFGITYFIIAMLEIIFAKRTELESTASSIMHDVVTAIPQWIFVIAFIVIHTCITFLVEVPGCGKGYLGPGGHDDAGKYFNCTGGVAGYLDRQIFGEHIYRNSRFHEIYGGKLHFDPEGFLSTFSSILLVYLGVQAGRIYNTFPLVRSKVIRWCIWGLVNALVGAAMCEFKKENGLIPLNKQLWSLSFVLVLGGLAFLIQVVLFLLVDVTRKWGGRPLFYPGMNAIILYVGHELFKGTFPFSWIPLSQTHASYLFMNLWGTFLWVSFSIFLYKHNIFFSL